MDDQALRVELAALLRDNVDVVSARLEKKFVEEYPAAAANSMSAERIHRWTLVEIELIARGIESDDASVAVHQGNFGHIVMDKDGDVTQFASSLASTLFVARHIAPLVFLLTDISKNEGKGQELLELYERFVRSMLTRYCELFVQEVDRPGALMKKWDILSGLELDIEPEVTPAKKHRRVEVFPERQTSQSMKSIWEGDFLTSRERDVLKQLVSGKSNGEIADALDIRQNTVKNHVARLFDKFGVSSRAELIAEVLGEGQESLAG